MAKFSRFDPRNKKQNRNKKRSLDRDIRIHEERSSDKYKFEYVKGYDDEDEYEEWPSHTENF